MAKAARRRRTALRAARASSGGSTSVAPPRSRGVSGSAAAFTASGGASSGGVMSMGSNVRSASARASTRAHSDPSRATSAATTSGARPSCSPSRRSRVCCTPARRPGSAPASAMRSHSESTPIDRCDMLAEPMRSRRSSTIITLECTNVATSCAREATGYTRRSRWCRSPSTSTSSASCRSTPIVCFSIQPSHSFGMTTITSGPSGSSSRCARARARLWFVKYWLSM